MNILLPFFVSSFSLYITQVRQRNVREDTSRGLIRYGNFLNEMASSGGIEQVEGNKKLKWGERR
jgi:hypothetical protein